MKKFVETFEQTITNFVGASLSDKCDEVTFVQALCGVFTSKKHKTQLPSCIIKVIAYTSTFYLLFEVKGESKE